MDSNILVKYLEKCRIFPLPSSLDAFKKEVYERFSINPSVKVNLQYYSECWGEHIDLEKDSEIVPGKKYRVLVEVPKKVLYVAAPANNSDKSLSLKISDIKTVSSVNQQSVQPSSNSNTCSSTSLSVEGTQIRIPAENFSETLRETLKDQKPLPWDLKSELIQVICENVKEKYPTSLKMTDMARSIISNYPFLKGRTGNGYAKWRSAINYWFMKRRKSDQSKEVLKRKEKAILRTGTDTSVNLEVSDSSPPVSLERTEQSTQPPSNSNSCSSTTPFYAVDTQVRVPAEKFSETLRRTLMDRKPLRRALKYEFMRVICKNVGEKYPSSIKVTDMARSIIFDYPYLKDTTGNGYAGWRKAIRNWFKNMRRYDQSKEVLKRKKNYNPSTDSDTSVDIDISDIFPSVSIDRIQQSIQPPSNSNPCPSALYFFDTGVRIPTENFSEYLRKTLRDKKPLSRALKSEFMQVICEQVEEMYPSSLKITDMARTIIYDYPYLKETTGNGYAKLRETIKNWFGEKRRHDYSKVLKGKKKAVPVFDADTSEDLEVSDNGSFVTLDGNQQSNQLPPCTSSLLSTKNTQIRIPAENFSGALHKTLKDKKPLSKALKFEFIRVICKQVEERYPPPITMTNLARAIICDYPYLKETTGSGYARWRLAIMNWFKLRRRFDQSKVLNRETNESPATVSDTSMDLEDSDCSTSVSFDEQTNQPPLSPFSAITQIRIPVENFSETLRKTLRDKQPLSWVLKSEFIRVICQQIEDYPTPLTITDFARAIICDYPYLKETTGNGYDRWREAIRNSLKKRRMADRSEEALKRKRSEKGKEPQEKKLTLADLIPDTNIKQEIEIILETLNEIEREF